MNLMISRILKWLSEC